MEQVLEKLEDAYEELLQEKESAVAWGDWPKAHALRDIGGSLKTVIERIKQDERIPKHNGG